MPQLAEPNLCTGCTACASACPKNCISMKPDATGFLHPVLDESSCVGCGLCEQVCPVLHPLKASHTPTAYAAKSLDEASRQASTSGGVFTELAGVVLANGGAVYGAAYDENFKVCHICVENKTKLDRLRGAKYAQSDLGSSFREIKQRLEKGQQVLFSGTPCQVLGLKSFLKRDYENLILVDLVCHSVPSPLAWEKYLEYIRGEKQLAAVNLRSKDTGWSRYGYSNRFDFTDGSYRMEHSGYISRPACTSCPAKGYGRVSDLSLGDFWGIWDIMPEMDDNRGTSLVLVHSPQGAALLTQVRDRLVLREVSLESASQQNPAIIRASAANPLREQVMDLVLSGDLETAARKITVPAPVKPSLLCRLLQFLKRTLRT